MIALPGRGYMTFVVQPELIVRTVNDRGHH
jgi:hypothetical protein